MQYEVSTQKANDHYIIININIIMLGLGFIFAKCKMSVTNFEWERRKIEDVTSVLKNAIF